MESIFAETSTYKEWFIQGPGFNFTNDNIVGESLNLKERLCSSKQLTYGNCESSEVSVTVLNDDGASLVGLPMHVVCIVYGANNRVLSKTIGNYYITEDNLSSDRKTRTLKAYDLMYTILNSNYASWYNSLPFPLTLQEFRGRFFSHINLFQESVSLINDDMVVEKTVDTDELTGATILMDMCEVNGVFGHISPQAQSTNNDSFKYVSLMNEGPGLYPSEELYPSETLYPSNKTMTDSQLFEENEYFNVEYANFISNRHLDRLIIRQDNDDVGVSVGDSDSYDNVYVVENNFLLYGKTAQELQTIGRRLYDKIKGIYYVPLKAYTYGNPELSLGQAVAFKVKGRYIKSFILERNLTGINALKDTYVANGSETFENLNNGINSMINQLRGKTTRIKADVDGLSVTVEDLAEDVSAELELKVDKDDNDQVVSMINASADVIKLNSNRLIVNSTNFSLDAEGNVSARGNLQSLTSAEGWYCNLSGHGINCYKNNEIQGWFGMAGDNPTLMNIYAKNGFYIRGDGNEILYRVYKPTTAPYESRTVHSVSGYVQLNSPVDNTVVMLKSGYYYSGGAIILGEDGYSCNLGVKGNVYCNNLLATGTKNRAVNTENYGTRLLNAFETTTANFSDLGSGEIGKDKVCEIMLDSIFVETVDLSKPYQVFITQTSEKATSWVEKKNDRFIVHGEYGATFDWMIVARQKDYSDIRLEELKESEDE